MYRFGEMGAVKYDYRSVWMELQDYCNPHIEIVRGTGKAEAHNQADGVF